MRDQENGVKEQKLEKEKRVYNHCFTGAVIHIGTWVTVDVLLICIYPGQTKGSLIEPLSLTH